MAIVKLSKALLNLEPGIKDFILSRSSVDALDVTTPQDHIEETESYVISFEGFPESGTVDICFRDESLPAPEGYTAFSGVYRDRFKGYWK